MHIASLVLATAFRDASVVGFPGYSSYFVDTSQSSLVENADDLDGRPMFALTKLAGTLDLVVMRKAAVSMGADGVRSMYENLHPVRRVRPGQVRSRGARE